MNRSYFYHGPILIILAAFLWSLDGFLRQGLYSLPSSLIVFLEHFLGFIVMLPVIFIFWPQIKKITGRDWLGVAWIVVWGGVLGTLFYTQALSLVNYIDLSVVVLLQKLQPVFAIFLAMLILKEKPRANYWWWAALALVGGYMVSFKDLVLNFHGGLNEIYAAGLAVLAAFAWGSSTVFGRQALQRIDFKLLTALRFGLTALLLLPVVLFSGFLFPAPEVNTAQWGKLVAIVFSTGLLAVIVYYAGLKSTKASVATICEMFWPVSAVILDYIIHRTVLTPIQFIGAGVLLFAIYKISSKPFLVQKNPPS